MMNVAIIGDFLGGLAAANVFHRQGATVTVFEKSPSSLENRGGSLGFLDVGLWQKVRGSSLLRGGRQASYSDGLSYYGDMWKFLYAVWAANGFRQVRAHAHCSYPWY
jgi:2-polyprenyl-6-methoxyphenol hydroxylase-like FAD-dependent oxidoreductase